MSKNRKESMNLKETLQPIQDHLQSGGTYQMTREGIEFVVYGLESPKGWRYLVEGEANGRPVQFEACVKIGALLYAMEREADIGEWTSTDPA